MPTFLSTSMDPDECLRCGAPRNAHGPNGQCDPDAVKYSDLLGARAVETPGTMPAPKTRLGLIIALVGGFITIGAGISSCASTALMLRQVSALERIAERVERRAPPQSSIIGTYYQNPPSTLRRAPSGQVEALIDDAWIPTKLWIHPDGNVQIIVPINVTDWPVTP